jgi:hypothetical protein
MKHMLKLGVAGSLALVSVGAHAAITVGTIGNTSSGPGTLGDVVLFADIYNGSTLVSAYVGDTGASVGAVGAGTAPTTAFDDANLQTFLGKYQTGYTLLWAVEGAGTTGTAPAPYVVSTGPTSLTAATATFAAGNGQLLKSYPAGFIPSVNNYINGSATANSTSFVGADTSANTGNYFDPTKTGAAAGAADWFGASSYVNATGLGTVATLYTLSAAGTGNNNPTTLTADLGVSLTSTGLVYSALNNNNTVPLPAAVWLLGSGLLGLAGVGRRKNKAA